MKFAVPNIVWFFAHGIENFVTIQQKAVTFGLLTAVTVQDNDVWVVTPSGLVEIYVR
jgi:hypothetical protein